MTPQLEQIGRHVLGAAGLVVIGLFVWHAVISWQPRDPDLREARRRRGLAAANRGRRG